MTPEPNQALQQTAPSLSAPCGRSPWRGPLLNFMFGAMLATQMTSRYRDLLKRERVITDNSKTQIVV
jgi:hypothetical protein